MIIPIQANTIQAAAIPIPGLALLITRPQAIGRQAIRLGTLVMAIASITAGIIMDGATLTGEGSIIGKAMAMMAASLLGEAALMEGTIKLRAIMGTGKPFSR
ncbi:MAG: hypothetical protein WAW36_15825 [Methylovulum miyakonense]|uniref:hypothetical protein n=1 Tax=Methylovulum miyakonense TaxID=645578 RepID=UPI003BB5345F